MKNDTESALLTVAAIRPAKGEANTEILFNERQRIFALGVKGRAAGESPQLLRHALGRNQPVRVLLDNRRGLVARVTAAAPGEIEEFQRGRILLDQPDRILPIEVSRIDPTIFNVVDRHLKCRSFRLCTRIIPSYATARNIFDFCAQQSCNLPGPYGITPCIPFQYVRDGCYARAHKMRWIITTRYRYCCEKVFSFANQNADTLAVKADKWGGCCVTWWYHVAPLVRVKIKLGRFSIVLAMVIDPGMFNKPVLLSTWLSAQENTACSSRAKVSMYSIQPGSAYSPANYAGTAFTTDPSYVATNATLLAYRNLVTCP